MRADLLEVTSADDMELVGQVGFHDNTSACKFDSIPRPRNCTWGSWYRYSVESQVRPHKLVFVITYAYHQL